MEMLPRYGWHMCVFFLTPAFLFTAFMVDASGPAIGSLPVVKTNDPAPEDPFFAQNPTFHHEKSFPIQVVLSMLGASSFKAVMEQRRTSEGAESKNILVAFSIPNCDTSEPECKDEEFTIFDQSATNFTVEARLVVNPDLNKTCKFEEHKGHVGYIKYPGHAERPNGTAEYINYFVVYKCGTFERNEFLAAESGSGTNWWIVSMIIIGFFLGFFLGYFGLRFCCCARRKNAAPANQDIQLTEMNQQQQQPFLPANNVQPPLRERIRRWAVQLYPNFETRHPRMYDALFPGLGRTDRASSEPNTISTDRGTSSSSEGSSEQPASSSNPGTSANMPSDASEQQSTTSQKTPEPSQLEDEPKEQQSSSKTTEATEESTSTDNKAYEKSGSGNSGSEEKEEHSN